jgi:hypothetical protein
MPDDVHTIRSVLCTYEDIDAALAWLRRYTTSTAELWSLIVQYYAVDLDMLADRLPG